MSVLCEQKNCAGNISLSLAISAPNRVCEAFKTAPTWQEAARCAAAGAQPRVRRLCPAMGAKGWHGRGARQSRAVCQLCAGAGERGTV